MVSSLLLSWWSWRDAIHPEIDTMVQWTFVLGWHMLHADIAKGWQRKSISAASWMCSRRWFGPRGRAHRLSADAGANTLGLVGTQPSAGDGKRRFTPDDLPHARRSIAMPGAGLHEAVPQLETNAM